MKRPKDIWLERGATDPLAEAKRLFESTGLPADGIRWLIDEVQRLRAVAVARAKEVEQLKALRAKTWGQ